MFSEIDPNLKLKAQLILKNSSQIIWKGPCLLCSVGVTGDGAAGEIDLYDGTNDKAEHKLKMKCLNATTFSMNSVHNPQLNYGIYMKVNAATTYGWVVFIPQDEGAKYNETI